MFINTQNVCRILGIHQTDWITIRRVFQPDLGMTTKRGSGPTRPKQLWSTSRVIQWLDMAMRERLPKDVIRQLLEASEVIPESAT